MVKRVRDSYYFSKELDNLFHAKNVPGLQQVICRLCPNMLAKMPLSGLPIMTLRAKPSNGIFIIFGRISGNYFVNILVMLPQITQYFDF